MLHEPAAPAGKNYAVAYKTRLGIWMFLCYSIFYAGFVAINLSVPQLMEKIVLARLNLATVYGFALIAVALVQAMVYSALCSKQERLAEVQDKLKGGK
jgi:uncharacterized membrane protein (DUF485 family)